MSAFPGSLHAVLSHLPSHQLVARLERFVERELEGPAPTQRQPVGNPFVQRFALQRMLGVVMAGTGLMEARQNAGYHRLLHRLHLLDRLPSSWDADPVVSALPVIGSRPVPPAPDLPTGIEGPWPQTPVLNPGLYAPVMNLPREEEHNHLRFNVLRYLGQSMTSLPGAVGRAVARQRLGELDDTVFASLLQDTTYAQYIRDGLDPQDIQAFGHLLKRAPETYFKVDFEVFADMDTIDPELPKTGSVTLLERDSTGRFWPLAIRLGDQVIEPGHAHAWEVARYLVLQHAATQTIVIWHPRLHFPCDAVHAITLSILPDGHPIKQLVLPHTPLTLGLHQAVIHNQRSVFHNNQRELYTPLAYTTRAIHEGATRGRAGIPGNRGYPAYRWGEDLIGEHVRYGRFRKGWADTFYRLCEGVLAGVSANDRHVAAWADHIATYVPGFPDASVIFREDHLVRAVATWMRGVTVFHTADHYNYSQIPMRYAPLRVRTKLPHPGMPKASRRRLLTREDRLRQSLAHELFFRALVVYPLSDVRYDVPAGRPQAAVRRFWRDVGELDESWAGSGFPTSRQIGASIHY